MTTPAAVAPTTPPAAPAANRVIPGLQSSAAAVEAKKSRSRARKAPKGTDAAGAVASAGAATTKPAPDAAPLAPPLVADEVEEPLEDKKTAVEAVHKRVRAATKKIQRIVTYEEKTEALNADQQKAIASKPVLEAIVKELNELLVILKAEEADEDRRQTVITSRLEKRHAQDVATAVAAAKAESQDDLVLLLQFIHLHGLYTPSEQSFAPAALPSTVANATGQEVAAVRCLQSLLASGPLLGGHGDALERLSKLASGSSEFVLGDVTYGRIKELIAGMTSAPEVAPTPTVESSMPATPNDSVIALVDGDAEPTASPSFLQASELEAPVEAEPEVVEAAPVPEPTVEAPAPIAPAAVHPGWGVHVAATNGVPPVAAPAPAPLPESAPTLDWSADDNELGLPSLDGLAPPPAPQAAAPAVQAPAPVVVESDGFTQAPGRGARRGNGPSFGEQRGGRGGHRGGPEGGRGGGSYRGRGAPREGGAPGGDGTWTRAPRAEGEGGYRGRGGYQGGERGQSGEGRGRGGRGRGEGRGRGGERRGPSNGGPSPVAASPAPATPVEGSAPKW